MFGGGMAARILYRSSWCGLLVAHGYQEGGLGKSHLPVKNWRRELNLQLRKPVHDLHRPQAHGDHAEEEFEGILGIAYRLSGSEVGLVDDARCQFRSVTDQQMPEADLFAHRAVGHGASRQPAGTGHVEKVCHLLRLAHLCRDDSDFDVGELVVIRA